MALFHLLTVHTFGLLSSKASLGVITTLLTAHNTAAVLLGRTWDFTALPAKLLHTVRLVGCPRLRGGRGATRLAGGAGPVECAGGGRAGLEHARVRQPLASIRGVEAKPPPRRRRPCSRPGL